MKIESFKDLIVWQKAHRFVLVVYELSKRFPREEVYGLTTQLRRAAVSVPANIVEGFRRRSWKEKVQFLSVAHGSLEECSYYLLLANDLGYGSSAPAEELIEEISKLLTALSKSIQSRHTS